MTTTADDVWKLLPELIESQKETDRKFQETDFYINKGKKYVQPYLNGIDN
ncbi:hypothetical protein [Geminocystis herdmanii]|nr:hypothetical protein [Geminocystis herdmanii]